jgi:replicative DNA helicase
MDEVTLLDQQLEDRYIRSLLEYPKLLQLTSDSLEESNFSTKSKARLYNSIITYWSTFESIPSLDLLIVTIEEMYPGEQSKLIIRLAQKILKLPAPEWKWILSKIDQHIKTIQIQKSLFEASELLHQGDVKSAENRLVDSIRNSGVLSGAATNDLNLNKNDIYEIARSEDNFCCPTRIYALDDYLKGLFRKELFLVMAPMNVGKSWAVVHFATSALLSGKYVLYLTLEMSKERVLQRTLQNISGTYSPRFEDDHQKEIERWDENWQEKEKHQASSLFNVDQVHKNLSILKKFGGMLSVKEYASGTASIKDIEKEVTLFDVTFGKLPDIIIVDGLMDIKYQGSTDTNRQRLGLSQVARELRRIASEYNAAVVTTHQGNRESIGANLVGTQHTGESIGIVQIADTGISLNQSKAEYQTGKMRINVMRSRNQTKWGLVEIWQNLNIGQFCQASKILEDYEQEEVEEQEDKNRRRIRKRQ